MESFFWRKVLARTGVGRMLPSVQRWLGGAEQYLHWYSDRTLALPLRQLHDHTLLPHISTPDSIHLALGVPRCELHSSLPRFIPEQITLPAWGDLELRTALAELFALNHGVERDPTDEWFITHGACGALASVIDAFVNPNDRVVLFDPTSPIFALGLAHRRANIAWVRTWSDEGMVRFNIEQFTRAMRGAKMLLLADPVNPTGCVFAAEDMEQIAFWARKHDVLLVQDVSFDWWRERPAPVRLAALPHAEDRVLTCGSFAKSHGLTSVRVGWLTGQRHLLGPCAAAGLMNAPFVAPLCQRVALHALRHQQDTRLTVRNDLNQRRGYVGERLRTAGFQPWAAQAGFFLWLPVPTLESATEFAQRLLTQTGVLVNPGEPFGPSGDRYVRLSFATEEGRLAVGLQRLADFMHDALPALPAEPESAPATPDLRDESIMRRLDTTPSGA